MCVTIESPPKLATRAIGFQGRKQKLREIQFWTSQRNANDASRGKYDPSFDSGQVVWHVTQDQALFNRFLPRSSLRITGQDTAATDGLGKASENTCPNANTKSFPRC